MIDLFIEIRGVLLGCTCFIITHYYNIIYAFIFVIRTNVAQCVPITASRCQVWQMALLFMYRYVVFDALLSPVWSLCRGKCAYRIPSNISVSTSSCRHRSAPMIHPQAITIVYKNTYLYTMYIICICIKKKRVLLQSQITIWSRYVYTIKFHIGHVIIISVIYYNIYKYKVSLNNWPICNIFICSKK